jgi:hypothetical protein
MDNRRSIFIIEQLRKQWIRTAVAANVLLALSSIAILFVILVKLLKLDAWWVLPLSLLSAIAIFLFRKKWKLSKDDVALYINRAVPQAEESTQLLLQPKESLGFLEQLQVRKVEGIVTSLTSINPLKRDLKRALIIFFLALSFASSIYFFLKNSKNSVKTVIEASSFFSTKQEVKPAEIASSKINIIPPGYTGNPVRQQDRFNMVVEENATVVWELETSMSVNTLQLKINDKAWLPMQAVNAAKTKWKVQKSITQPGFYQVQVNNKLSELYRIEMIKDKPPVIIIKSPTTGTVIKSGQPRQFVISSVLSDDYGIKDARIFATIASGNGEAVKFKEQQIAFNNFSQGTRNSQLQQLINCRALGMQPGDELYFFVRAIDNNNQQTRSDIMIVILEDTAQLMSMDGLVMGLDLKPEFFRSQRQIIIEAEQLLKDRDTISIQNFNTKSNDLGIDQQLLRLRYGKFLGEESSIEIGADHDDHDKDAAPVFGDANAVLEQFSHKHDIAEDATFFDPETKKQLKATLGEMWKSEAKLRLYKPAEALPFAYNALRLLKDLQQKSRVYVAKTSSKTTPLQPKAKRLTGELDKIAQPTFQSDSKPENNDLAGLRQALAVLEEMKLHTLQADKLVPLQQAGQQLVEAASANPAKYISAIEAYKRIVNGRTKKNDIKQVEKALQTLLQDPANVPSKKVVAPSSNLSQQYFNNLKKGNR